MYSRIGAAAYKTDITNTVRLCAALGNPHQRFKTIHIAGTNGKGSVSHMLAAILQQAGYKTGLYTSPHLHDFRERIRIDGKVVNENYVVEFVRKIQPLIDEVEPSFFEITVAMAFDYFAQEQIDIAVIETGLGGRLDSTNIIVPEVSVITNIGLDHQYLLGDTILQIAGEKAGIIKSKIPAVIGETLPETKQVFVQKAAHENAAIIFASEELWISEWWYDGNYLSATVAHRQLDEDRQTYQLDLTGLYQLKNLLTVIATVTQLRSRGYHIEENDVKHALKQVKKMTGLHGRWQVLQQHPKIVMDVAHNEDGIKQLVEQLEHETFNHLHIVVGFAKDKNLEQILSLLPAHASYYFSQASIPRALPAQELKEKAAAFGLQGEDWNTVAEALNQAKAKAGNEDLVLVCGSVFVVGEVVV